MSELSDKTAKIFVAGHRGLAGSAIVRNLRSHGFGNLILKTHSELDLADQQATRSFFELEKPDYVFLAAAKVGGILANDTYPADFIHQNLAIQTNVIHESWRNGVRRLIFLGSSCIYPRDCPQPIKEEYLLSGPLEKTNQAYALAKIAGIEMCGSYNHQYGTEFLCAMPTNLYGIGDNYDLNTSHVLPALIRKAHEARQAGAPSITVWGSGLPRREFLNSDDLAAALVLLAATPWDTAQKLTPSPRLPLINVGCGEDVTIRELAATVCKAVGFQGELQWDSSKPDGTPRKLLDTSRINALGWRAAISLEAGITAAYQEYLSHSTTDRKVAA